jgi:hypothetical protein
MAAGTLVSSGSSLNMPTGSGSERLRRASIATLNADWQELLSGTAGHIYTILSVVFCDQQSASGTINIRLNNGSNDIFLLTAQSVAADGTFVWNDKFVMEEDDDLDVYNSVTNGHWWITYIDQDWT